MLRGVATSVTAASPTRLSITIDATRLEETARKLRDLGFDHVKSVTGVDFPEENRIDLLYHISAFEDLELAKAIVEVRTSLNRSEPKVQSLVDIWPSAEYSERETSDLFGVVFEGQPSGRLLLPDSYVGLPPLRKDLKIKTEGIDA
jgi:NADH-quinone oxidoreductase subunit C